MVPIQTVLILLSTLLILSSCSQKTPPHSDVYNQSILNRRTPGTTNVSASPSPSIGPSVSPTDSPAPIGSGGGLKSFLKIEPRGSDSMSLMIEGGDAKTIYEMLALAAMPDPSAKDITGYKKQGSHMNCTWGKDGSYHCESILVLATGSAAEQSPKDDLVPFAPSLRSWSPGLTPFLTLRDPSKGPSVRIAILGQSAASLFNALTVPEGALVPGGGFGPGAVREGEFLTCFKQTRADDYSNVSFSCYLYLDAVQGGYFPASQNRVGW